MTADCAFSQQSKTFPYLPETQWADLMLNLKTMGGTGQSSIKDLSR